MEYRQLGRSGLRVSALTMGTMTFGGGGVFANVGNTGVDDARRQVDLCLDAGVNLIDTADVYSTGRVRGDPRRGARRPSRRGADRHEGPDGDGRRPERRRAVAPPHHRAGSRPACGGSAPTTSTSTRCTSGMGRRRWRRRSRRWTPWCGRGKVRYLGCSNYSGWQLMKALGSPMRGRLPAVRQPPDLLLAGEPGRGVRAGAVCRWTRGWASWCGARWPVVAVRQVPAGHLGFGGSAPERVGRATGAERVAPLRHDRPSGGNRFGARGFSRAGGPGLFVDAARGELLGDRGAEGVATGGQPGRGFVAVVGF